MAHHVVEPEVAGELGPSTVADTSVHPPVVSRLEYRFTDWLGDGTLETFPCFIVRDSIADQLASGNLTGYLLDDVTVTLSPEAEELIDTELPAWRWLKVNGEAGRDDFGINDQHSLVVSDAALEVLRTGGLDNADIETYG